MMRMAAAVCALAIVAVQPVHAAPASVPAMKALLDASGVRGDIGHLQQQKAEELEQRVRRANTARINANAALNPEQRAAALAALDRAWPETAAFIAASVSKPELTDRMVEDLAERMREMYSQEEAEQLTVFYRSELGKKSLSLRGVQTIFANDAWDKVMTSRVNVVLNAFQLSPKP